MQFKLMMKEALDFLLIEQNPDGGWGASKGKRSNTEATALALVGLQCGVDQAPAESIDRGFTWLSERQQADGSWPLTDQLREGSWTTALAVLVLSLSKAHRARAVRGADWLLHQQGRDLGWFNSLLYRIAPHRMGVSLDPDLKGWSWTPNTFSWVEPTAYTLMALKKLRPLLQETRVEERIRHGELLLYDRMCKGGGWNYGNSTVLGEELWPYPDTTALTLIALQDHREAAANQLSLRALRTMLTEVGSGLALSWSIICFALYGQDVSEWKKRLASSYEKTGFLGETKTVALALLAAGDGAANLRV